mgnify:FL=1
MARATLSLSVTLEPWVLPYVELMQRMQLGEAAATAVVAFINAHGVVIGTPRRS